MRSVERPVFHLRQGYGGRVRPAGLGLFVLVCGSCAPAPPDVAPPDPIAKPPIAEKLTGLTAEQVLTGTRIFSINNLNHRISAFNVIVDRPDALAVMRRVASDGRAAGQLYALVALRTLHPSSALDLETRLAASNERITFVDSDVAAQRSVGDLVAVVRERDLAGAFRRVRYDERVVPGLVTFRTEDGWNIYADLYGAGERGLVLVHGGRFTKESWSGQATQFANAGFRVLAIDMRGYGLSKNGPEHLNRDGYGSPLDVLAAIRYLRAAGATSVSIIGGSMGADAAAGASILARPSEIDGIVLLAGSGSDPGERLKGRKLFIVARNDANSAGPRLPGIRAQYERAAPPKELLLLDGAEHAQFLFQSDQGERLTQAIWRFLGVTH